MTLSRHFLRHVALNFIVIAPAFLVLFWLVQAPRFAETSLERSWSALTVLWLLFLLIWRYVDVFLPLALFLAVVSAFVNLEDDSEIIAAQALGMSKRKIALPILAVAGLVSCFLVLNTMFVAPLAFKRFMDLREARSTELFSTVLQAEQFITLTDGVILWMEKRAPNGDLRNLMIYDHRDTTRTSILYARSGRLSVHEDGFRLLLAEGVRHELHTQQDAQQQAQRDQAQETHQGEDSTENSSAYWLQFDRHSLVLERPPESPRRVHRVELSLAELFNLAKADYPASPIPRGSSPNDTGQVNPAQTQAQNYAQNYAERKGEFLAEAHRRIALPLWPPALALLALAAILVHTPASRRRRLSLAFSAAIVLVLCANFWLDLVAENPLLVAGIYAFPAITAMAAWLVLSLQDQARRTSPRKPLQTSP